MKQTSIAGLILLLSACATGEKKEAPVPTEPPRPPIDLHAIQHDLGMDSSAERVGYREKRFDACRFSADLQGISDCARAYFVQIGVQLSCRPAEEEGSTILDRGDLTPVGDRELTWQLGDGSGRIRTDIAGFGLILAIASRSMKMQGLRVSTGEDFLVMRAGQATRIVTPVSWCR